MQQKTRTIILLIYCLVFLANTLFAKPVIINLNKRTPENSAIRSAIFPGWGQIYNKQKIKGCAIGASSLLSITYSYMFYAKADDLYDKYEKAGVKNSSLYSDYEANYNQARYLSYLGVGIWIYGIVDAYLTVKQNNRNSVSLIKNGVFVDFSDSGCILAYRQNF